MSIDSNDFRVWRKQNKLNQSQIAEILGTTYETISNWERKGFPKYRNQVAVKMAKELVTGKRSLPDKLKTP